MPRFVIEREMPGAGAMTPQELRAASQKSCDALASMGPATQWVESFVTADKLYCVYYAPDMEAIREHAKRSGFPANRVHRVVTVIGPATAEA